MGPERSLSSYATKPVSASESLLPPQTLLASTTNPAKSNVTIQQIPPEIIAAIFSFVLDDRSEACHLFPKGVGNLFRLRDNSRLQSVAQVCHRWREILIGTSSLWSSVFYPESWPRPSKSCNLTSHFLKRRTAGALYIHWTGRVPPDAGRGELSRDTLDPLEVQQIHELHVRVMQGVWSEGWLPFPLTLAASNLERLCVTHEGTWKSASEVPLFEGPVLRRLAFLYMSNVPIFPGNPLPALTSLILILDSPCANLRPKWRVKDLLSLVASAYSLQQAYLSFLPPVERWAHEGTYPVAVLNHLRKLSVTLLDYCTSARDSFHLFLSHLRLPANCALRVSHSMDLRIYPGVVIPALERISDAHVVYDALRCSWYANIDPACSSSTSVLSVQAVGSSECTMPIRLDISAGPHTYIEDTVSLVRETLSVQRFSTATRLWISGAHTYHLLRGPNPVLATLSNVHTLILVDATLVNREDLALLWHSDASASNLTSLPCLTTLFVRLEQAQQLADVREVLCHRLSSGYPIRRLLVGYDGMLHSAWEEQIRDRLGNMVEELFIGVDAYDRMSWCSTVPRVCTDEEETSIYWPPWR
ncbi:hypothetical protein BD311DRAFT_496019 [Dichomitus squalens]|uniref:F-box domain-containing protein n=1 Tax=Dichomitus squalens TaxID=114155 RepID=A0A4Q9MDQ8_9APHY|nr:hypothetical protein BD311DRAFT_496019 [Dichomitus squalens]